MAAVVHTRDIYVANWLYDTVRLLHLCQAYAKLMQCPTSQPQIEYDTPRHRPQPNDLESITESDDSRAIEEEETLYDEGEADEDLQYPLVMGLDTVWLESTCAEHMLNISRLLYANMVSSLVLMAGERLRSIGFVTI